VNALMSMRYSAQILTAFKRYELRSFVECSSSEVQIWSLFHSSSAMCAAKLVSVSRSA